MSESTDAKTCIHEKHARKIAVTTPNHTSNSKGHKKLTPTSSGAPPKNRTQSSASEKENVIEHLTVINSKEGILRDSMSQQHIAILAQHFCGIQKDKLNKIAELKRIAEQQGEVTQMPSYWPEWSNSSPLAKALAQYEHKIVQPFPGAYQLQDDGPPCMLKPKVRQNDRKTGAIIRERLETYVH